MDYAEPYISATIDVMDNDQWPVEATVRANPINGETGKQFLRPVSLTLTTKDRGPEGLDKCYEAPMQLSIAQARFLSRYLALAADYAEQETARPADDL